MTPSFKFLRRVRIHGGESGAVARALHHEVKSSSLYQADSGKALESTFNERKQMSTKTSFKRIALVAVSALGFGVLSSVPSSANSAATVAFGTITSNIAIVGQTTTVTVPMTVTGGAVNDTFTVAAVITGAPATSTRVLNLAETAAGDIDMTTSTAAWAATACTITPTSTGSGEAANTSAVNSGLYTITTAACPSTGASTHARFTFTPDVAGAYSFVVFRETETLTAANNGINSVLNSGETAKYFSVTAVAANAASTSLTKPISANVASYESTGRAKGTWLKVSLLDSAGVATRPGASNQVVVTIPTGVTMRAVNATTGLAITATDYGLIASDFDVNGNAWLNVTAAAGTYTLSTKLLGGTDTASSIGVTFTDPTVIATVCAADTQTTPITSDIRATGSNMFNTSAEVTKVSSTQAGTTFTVCNGTASSFSAVRVVDTDSLVFGNELGGALEADHIVSMGSSAGTAGYSTGKYTGSIALPGTITNNPRGASNAAAPRGFTVFAQDTGLTTSIGASNIKTVLSNEAAGSTTLTILPATTVQLVNGGSIEYTAECLDQYGAARVGIAMTAQISAGRNLQAAATNLVTDASGLVKFKVTDAAPTSTTLTSTVTFSGCSSASSATINYVAAATAPTTMTMSPVTTSTSPSAISIGSGSATSWTDDAAVAATLKDANGVLLVGVPVTLTYPSDLVLETAVTLSTDTTYTNSLGVAAWVLGTKKAGSYKVTATAGGVAKDVYLKFSGSTARVVSITAGTTSGDVTPITVKVADAYGNGVGSVAVTITSTGAGYFQGIPLSSSQTTTADGTISAAWIGSGTVTATITGGQSADAAALIGTTAAAGFPAGVATVSATVTGGANIAAAAAEAATDAAAEAIDAANAATDAANLAAEAADAATVAAEEARDAADAATAAVEELATQVATLMAALKAQITTLANTVAKIAKKVKA